METMNTELEDPKLELPQHIRKSNALIQASYRLSVLEQRIILACITQLPAMKEITDEVMYTVRAQDISELAGTASKSTYAELKQAALRLKRREVWIPTKPNSTEKHKKTVITGWVQTIQYVEDEGYVELRFSKDILPYISQISSNYTPYELRDVIKLTNSYSIRLYEILIQWRSKGYRELSVDELRDYLRLEDKYKSIKDLKKYVIDPSIKQINEHTPITVEWNQRKTGRRVSHLLFFFTEKQQPEPEQQPEKEPEKPIEAESEVTKVEPKEKPKKAQRQSGMTEKQANRKAVSEHVMDIEDMNW